MQCGSKLSIIFQGLKCFFSGIGAFVTFPVFSTLSEPCDLFVAERNVLRTFRRVHYDSAPKPADRSLTPAREGKGRGTCRGTASERRVGCLPWSA